MNVMTVLASAGVKFRINFW